MKKYFSYAIGICCSILTMECVGQIVSHQNNLIEHTYEKPFNIWKNDPIREWPDCSAPKDVLVAENRDVYEITWDGEEQISSKYYYEVETSGDRSTRNLDSEIVYKNAYVIQKQSIGRNDVLSIKIRKVCYVNATERLYSEWVVQEVYASQSNGCSDVTGGSIIYENCSSGQIIKVCPDVSFTISENTPVMNCTSNITYEWWESDNCVGNFTIISGANSPELTVVMTGKKSYKRKAICEGCSQEYWSNILCFSNEGVELNRIGNSTCRDSSSTFSVLNSCTYSDYFWSNGSTSHEISVQPTVSTTYIVTVTNSSGCAQTSSISKIVNPAVTSHSNVQTLCNGNGTYDLECTVHLQYPHQGYFTYRIDGLPHQTILIQNTSSFLLSINDLIADGLPHVLYLTTSCNDYEIDFTAPQCHNTSSCNITNLGYFQPTNCTHTTYTLPVTFNWSGPQGVTISVAVNGQMTEVQSPASGQSMTVDVNNIPYSTTPFNITASVDAGGVSCSASRVGTSVTSSTCNSSACTITYINGTCNGSAYNVEGSVFIAQPVAGSSVTVTDQPSGITEIIDLTPGVNMYYFEIHNLMADGLEHTLSMGGTSCADEVPTTNYLAPSICGNTQCSFNNLSAVVGDCDSNDNTFDITVTASIFCAFPDILTITVEGYPDKTITVPVDAGQHSVGPIIIEGLNSDGATFHVYGGTQNAGGNETIVQAPDMCSDLPPTNCGDPYENPPIDPNKPLLDNAASGDVFYVANIPFIIQNVYGESGNFSGIGYMNNPFSDKKLRVSFTNITVNIDHQVVSGEVTSVAAPITINQMMTVDTFSIGGPICQPDPLDEENGDDEFDPLTGLNSRGFGRDGLYYPDSTRFDPKGYDYNGIHKDTKTPYNRSGCDMYDKDIDGNPCVTDTTLIAMQDSIIHLIVPDSINHILNTLRDKFADSLATFNCDGIRAIMNAKIIDLKYEERYIKGNNNEYFEPGMHVNFSSEPKPLLDDSDRNPDAIILEQKHIELYECDMLSSKMEKLLGNLQGVDTERLSEYVSQRISQLNATQLQNFQDSAAEFDTWLTSVIEEFLSSNGNPPGFGYKDVQPYKENRTPWIPKKKSILSKPEYESDYIQIASTQDEWFGYKPKPGEEETWMYYNGYKEIKGVDRAYFLEEAYRQWQQKSMVSQDTQFLYTPLLLSKDTAGLKYNIYLDNIRINPSGAALDAYFIFEVPNSDGKKMVMKAMDIEWGSGGLIGESRLELGSVVEIRMTNAFMLRLNPSGPSQQVGTYVSWDCNGFTGMNVNATIEVCEEYIKPLNAAPGERFQVHVHTKIRHWSDMYFNVSAPKSFVVTGYEDYIWNLNGLTVDMSDYESPSGSIDIPNFTSKNYSNGGFEPAWRGFMMRELSVTFPNNISGGNGQPMTVSVQDLIIDDMGASGMITATNLLNIANGNIGGWPFSIDTARIVVLHNHIIAGGMAGQVQVPIFKEPMIYAAAIERGNKYTFNVATQMNQEVDMFLAETQLTHLAIKIESTGDEVLAEANMSGLLEIGKTGDAGGFVLPKVTFTNLTVRNKAPYFSSESFGIVGESDGGFKGFGILIDNIVPIQKTEVDVGLSFNVAVLLVGDSLGLTAAGGLEVMGELVMDAHNRQKWVYKDTDVNSFGIDVTFSAGHIRGYLQTFKEHPSYGSGFQGMVDMKFKAIGDVQAMALFGKTSFNYFFIDAQMNLTTGIPVGPIEINGFIGGLSYKMDVQSNMGGGIVNSSVLPPIGQSFSGNVYVPLDSMGMGFRAGITMRLAKNPKIFNGSVIFSMSFFKRGGLSRIALEGKGQLMNLSEIAGDLVEGEGLRPSGVSGSLSAHIRFEYNHGAEEFSGRLIAYLNAGVLRGVGAGGKMVDADIYVGPGKWYFYFGTPTNPCGLKLDLPFITTEMKSYLCVGTDIPGLPAIPSDVLSVAGNIRQNSLFANNGSGFLFGSSFSAEAKVNVLVASASMRAKAGFDMMVRDFGEASCAGRSGTVGINGWYGMGQMWALIEGELKVAGLTLFRAGIAGILQAQLPNPFYAQASMGVRVKTIFGSRDRTMKITLGEECRLQGASENALGMDVILSVQPEDGSKSMPTDIVPEVHLALPLNTKFEMYTDEFEVKMGTIVMKSLKTGLIYEHDHTLKGDGMLIEIQPKTMFNSHDTVEIRIKLNVYKNDVFQESEEKVVVFTTDSGFSTIPMANIEASYPMNGMSNFHRHEHKNNRYVGFIQLKSGMPEMFYGLPDNTTQLMRLTKEGGESVLFDYNEYDGLNGRLEFPLDPNMLEKEATYTLELVRITEGGYEVTVPSVGVPVQKRTNDINFGNMMGISSGTGNDAERSNVSVLASMTFRVSKYDRFMDKLNAMTKSGTSYVSTSEGFDVYDTEMVQFEVIQSGKLKEMYDAIYRNIELGTDEFPLRLDYLIGRGCDEILRSVSLPNMNDFIIIKNQVINNSSSNTGIIECRLQNKLNIDFVNLSNEIHGKFIDDVCKIEAFDGNNSNSIQIDMIHPDYLRFVLIGDNNPGADPISINIKYNVPGLGVTCQKRMQF